MEPRQKRKVGAARLRRRARREQEFSDRRLALHRFCDVQCDHDLARYREIYGEISVPDGYDYLEAHTTMLVKTSSPSGPCLLSGDVYTGPPAPILRGLQTVFPKWMDDESTVPLTECDGMKIYNYISHTVQAHATGTPLETPPKIPGVEFYITDPISRDVPPIPLADFLAPPTDAPASGLADSVPALNRELPVTSVESTFTDVVLYRKNPISDADVQSVDDQLDLRSAFRPIVKLSGSFCDGIVVDVTSDASLCAPRAMRYMPSILHRHFEVLPHSTCYERGTWYDYSAIDLDHPPRQFSCGHSLVTLRRLYHLPSGTLCAPPAPLVKLAALALGYCHLPSLEFSPGTVKYLVSSRIPEDHG